MSLRPSSRRVRSAGAIVVLAAIASTAGAGARPADAGAGPSGESAPSEVAPAPAFAGEHDRGRVMTLADRRHLLLRSGIGATAAELAGLDGLTREEGVARVIAGLSAEPHRPMPAWTRDPPPHGHAWPDLDVVERQRFERARDRELGELRLWWTRELLETPSPQTERLVLFWHDLFATSYHGTDRGSLAMARQNATFRRLGTGSWEALLKAMIRDAALLRFLDNDANRASSPNENLARELLELFTLGEGNYTQTDVREAARALTGHAASDAAGLAFRLRSWDHDAGEKRLFGVNGPHDGDALVELVLAQPAAARHLATRFWQAFVADGDPDARWLDEVSARFRASDHDIATLYRDTLSSAAFWDPANRGAIVRSPLDLAIGTARALDYPKRHWQSLARWQADVGMDLFAPPDVAGWREGEAFVTSGALLERERLLARLVAPPSGGMADGSSTDVARTAENGMANGASMDGAPIAATGSAAAISTDDAPAPSTAMAGAESMTGMPANALLEVRLAAEHYRGSAAWQVSLRAGEETVWTDLVRVLENGHDTERDGRLGGVAERPWRNLALPAPAEAVARADSVVVAFLNDTAGSDGDRNLYVDGARLDGVWLDASRGRQEGDCVPENPVDVGSLYCNGRVAMSRPEPTADDASTRPAWRASAAHVRWGSSDDGGRHVAGIALDDVATPLGDFHRLQFRLVATAEAGVEIEIDTFDCVPDCLADWPDCAWADERFPAARLVAFPIDGVPSGAREPCHLGGVDERERALLAGIARSAPSLIAHLRARPSGQVHRATLDALAARIEDPEPPRRRTEDGGGAENDGIGDGGNVTAAGAFHAGPNDGTAATAEPGWLGAAGERFVIDASFAPPDTPSPPLPPPSIRSDTPSLAVEALGREGLDVTDVLLAGFPSDALAPLARRDGEDAIDAIRRVVAHPAFQVR